MILTGKSAARSCSFPSADVTRAPTESVHRRVLLVLAAVGWCGVLVLSGGVAGSTADVVVIDQPGKSGVQEPAQLVPSLVSIDDFRFVGDSRGGQPQASLSQADTMLLAALRHVASLDEVLDMGVPFQTAQIQRLEEWGLLEQDGVEFRTLIPMLLEQEAVAFRSRVVPLVPRIADVLSVEVEALSTSLVASGQESSFSAILAWIIKEQAWRRLSTAPTVDLPGLVDQQRLEIPDRGWWGVLWYSEVSAPPLARFDFARSQGRSLLLDWDPGPLISDAAESAVPNVAREFLGSLDGDAEKVRRPEDFPQMIEAGLIDRRGRLVFPVLPWDPENAGSVAAAVDTIAGTLAREVLDALPVADLAGLLGTSNLTVIALLSYAEMAPELHSAFNAVDRADLIGSAPKPSAVLWLGLPQAEPYLSFPW